MATPDFPATLPSKLPSDATTAGKNFDNVDGAGQAMHVWMGQVAAEVGAIAAKLGVDSSGVTSTIDYKLRNLLGDVSGPSTLTSVDRIKGIPVSTVVPTTDEYLIYNGTQYIPQLATAVNLARITMMGHSYLAELGTGPYGSELGALQASAANGSNMGKILAAMLGANISKRWMVAHVPAVAAAASQITNLGLLPEDALVEAVYYTPEATLTGAATNTRRVDFGITWVTGQASIGSRQFDAGVNLTQYQSQAICTILAALDITTAFRVSPTLYATSPAFSVSSNPWLGTAYTNPTLLSWNSIAVGTGLADPGGIVTIRLGGTYRNVAIGAARLLPSGMYLGGWGTAWTYAFPWPLAPGPEVNATAAASAGTNVTINCDALALPITVGSTVRFAGGAIATNVSAAARGAASIVAGTLTGNVVLGDQGHALIIDGTVGVAANYESNSPPGLFLACWGVNDATDPIQDRVAYRETTRVLMSRALCRYFGKADAANIVYAAGNGAAAAWSNFIQPGSGQWLNWDQVGLGANNKRFTGAVGATPPTITIKVAPSFEGGTIALYFAGLQGAAHNAKATITVGNGDGTGMGNPPNGPCVADMTGQGPSPALGTATLTSITVTSGLPVVLCTGAGDAMRGRYVTGTGIAAGTTILATTSTSITLSQNASGNGSANLTVWGYTPVVKRLTGLAAGAKTIVVTLNSIDATDASAAMIFMGYGYETANLVAWMNIARTPLMTAGNQTNALNYNADVTAVIAGTGAAMGTGSVEPAMPATVLLVDLDAALAQNVANFGVDALHPNTRGNQLAAQAVYRAIRNVATVPQLIAR